MRFTKLRLNGFKSFVDPTDLVIADGLTGVVGPNGCGKSNLLEALRWVMGENRPTAMRGSGMEDVIFGGAATRNARNFAEVSLQIDNTDRLAPAGFNDEDQIDIIRRITRDAGSAYKLNGKDVRARDVSMLFADASTGAHSPALVRQGQISELINARPKARRRVLEEAAGISGLYQRRHEAELKLKGAEANLARTDDVLEQLSGQITTLARQAKQASRYREIGSELRLAEGMLLFVRWRDADAARLRAEEALRAGLASAAQAEAAAMEAVRAREAAEEALPPLREEDTVAAAILQRLMVERDSLQAEADRAAAAVETLSNRITQIDKDREREEALNADAGETVARLQDERADLQRTQKSQDARLNDARDAVTDARSVLAGQEAELSDLTEQSAALAARYQAIERRMGEAEKAVTRNTADAQAAEKAARDAADRLQTLKREAEDAEAALARATDLAARAEETLLETEAARAEVQVKETEARSARSEAEGRAGTLEAEVTALARVLERDRGDGDQVLDEIKVAPGFEAAIGAALSDDLKAARAPEAGATGWTDLPGYDTSAALPEGAQPAAEVAQAPAVLGRRLSQVGIIDAADGARLQPELQPGQRLVSREGDLWRWDGFAVAAADAVSTAARRLEQANRLSELEDERLRAREKADAAKAAHDTLAQRLAQLTEADKAARAARRDAETQLSQASRAAARAEADQSVLDGKLETLRLTASRHAEEADTARAELTRAQDARAELDDLDAVRGRLADVKTTVEAARMTMLAKRAAFDEVKRDGEDRVSRIAKIGTEITNWQNRLTNAASRLAELEKRRGEAETALIDARQKPGEIAMRREQLVIQIDEAESRKAASAQALSEGETNLRAASGSERDTERAASEAREARAAAEARRDAAMEAVQAAADRISEEQELTPEALRESLGDLPDPMPSADRIEQDVMRLRRQRDALGAVNLRAEEDAREVREEHETLASEKVDLEEAIAKLRTGINSLNKEGRERLLKAFDEVNANFSRLFTHLFGGGEARLVLVESDDPLEAGLEILCQPPGKKLSTLSLLSGGEQTLTALALIFGVFLANPAPICVLDEVDAPLDDANVTRFCDMLDEMTRMTDTRFLTITHHAVTMARMDRLFGVTMGEQGVSQLVSVDLKAAETLVA
ncbi:chromosome segregation SMC family protein [Gymnodinialimonas ceratoperidinii]|uniref:Chromosome partition protein Smc n=1 Tax=Gymnodinialimonas ceratoperidinii TaxID=2856823 RepID=A0A8F6TVT7_9RHOB|nr:AAA family ATPase [Gymnodinialimonas ceratoperidinii]QXT39851.1 AAA family ATPase [Gymnodinialimonas ceratoperidinii]